MVMTTHQNFAFQQLLSAWRRREDARATDNIAELTDARLSLEVARTDMRAAIANPIR